MGVPVGVRKGLTVGVGARVDVGFDVTVALWLPVGDCVGAIVGLTVMVPMKVAVSLRDVPGLS